MEGPGIVGVEGLRGCWGGGAERLLGWMGWEFVGVDGVGVCWGREVWGEVRKGVGVEGPVVVGVEELGGCWGGGAEGCWGGGAGGGAAV